MSNVSQTRTIDIFVRDRAGRPLSGAEISFSIDGKLVGQVDGSEGRGRIELSSTNDKAVDVTVVYRGETKTAKIAPGQDSFEFRYDVSISSGDAHLPLWAGLGLLLLSVVLAFSFKDPNLLQIKIVQGVFALGLGGIATEVTGFLKVDMNFGQRLVIGAGGAMAVFVILWFTNAKL